MKPKLTSPSRAPRVRRNHAREHPREAPAMRVIVTYEPDGDPARRARLVAVLREIIEIHCRR
jgi:hypothetical protein